ncbi:hypothetical protein GW17_00052782 [Ensete ventricosum]|nr:hypothetical protein GW17_00052782 [Ensete ventricosum]
MFLLASKSTATLIHLKRARSPSSLPFTSLPFSLAFSKLWGCCCSRMASTSAVGGHMSNVLRAAAWKPSVFASPSKGLYPKTLSFPFPCSREHKTRSLRVYGLFGGKKDKSENADDAPSKFCLVLFCETLILGLFLILCSAEFDGYCEGELIKVRV